MVEGNVAALRSSGGGAGFYPDGGDIDDVSDAGQAQRHNYLAESRVWKLSGDLPLELFTGLTMLPLNVPVSITFKFKPTRELLWMGSKDPGGENLVIHLLDCYIKPQLMVMNSPSAANLITPKSGNFVSRWPSMI